MTVKAELESIDSPNIGDDLASRLRQNGWRAVCLARASRPSPQPRRQQNFARSLPCLRRGWKFERQHDSRATGRTETGTGMSGYYAQMVAEELSVRPETISLIMGDTDKTPDGGYSAGFLSGMANVRKVAAYTYQALLGLAATQLGVPVAESDR